MATYRYKAKAEDGKIVSGKIEAKDEQGFYKELENRKLYCISFKEKKEATRIEIGGKLSLKELNVFCRELGVMVSAGVPIIDVLNALHKRCKEKKLKRCYMALVEQIETGSSLAEAMRSMGNVFPDILIAMVNVGEQSGFLDVIVSDMSEFYAKEHATRSKVQTMMIYPTMLFAVTILVVTVVFTFVLPKFFKLFVGKELPLITKVLMGVSNFLVNDWDILLLVVAVFALTFLVLLKSKMGRYYFDKMKCNIPVISKLLEKTVIARFSNAMGIMISNGIPILQALEIVSDTLGNVYTRERMAHIREEVEKGITLSESMEKDGMFEDMVWSMMSTGEETGRSGEMFQKLYAYYSQESDIATQKLLAILEPAIMVVIGLLIGAVLFSILVPIYSIYS